MAAFSYDFEWGPANVFLNMASKVLASGRLLTRAVP